MVVPDGFIGLSITGIATVGTFTTGELEPEGVIGGLGLFLDKELGVAAIVVVIAESSAVAEVAVVIIVLLDNAINTFYNKDQRLRGVFINIYSKYLSIIFPLVDGLVLPATCFFLWQFCIIAQDARLLLELVSMSKRLV